MNIASHGACRPGFKLRANCVYTTLIVGLSVWVLQSFLLALLVACVTAVAS
jgi:hypothetical protein